MVYGTQITIVFMGFINQQTSLGGPTVEIHPILVTQHVIQRIPPGVRPSQVSGPPRARSQRAADAAGDAAAGRQSAEGGGRGEGGEGHRRAKGDSVIF